MARTLLATGFLCAFLAAWAAAGDWPQFRGPGGAGLADAAKLPTQWGPEQNIRWKIEMPGVAWSSPIVLGDRLYLTTATTEKQQRPQPFNFGGGGGGRGGRPRGERPDGPDAEQPDGDSPAPPAARNREGAPPRAEGDGDQPGRERPGGRRGGFGRGPGGAGGPGGPGGFGRGGFGRGGQPPDALYRFEVYCLDRKTGDVVWKQLAVERKPTIPTHRTNTYASETPITDGQRIYAYFGMTGLFCFDLEGHQVWAKDLGSYPMSMGWGTGSSPVLVDDLLILQCDNDEKSFLVALDKKTGDEKWRVARDERSTWSTPYVWRHPQRTEIVTAGGAHVRSYDPADGALLWELDGMRGRCSATPVGDDQRVYFGTGGGGGGSGPLVAVKAGSTGTFSLAASGEQPEQIAWVAANAGPPMASPLVYKGYIYVPGQGGGMLSCYSAADGKRVYQKRLPEGKSFTASPWASDDKIFCLDEGGRTFVVKAGPDFEVLSSNALDEMCWSTPAVADDAVFLRGVEHLWCIAE